MKECNCDSRHKISAIKSTERIVINGKVQKKVVIHNQCNKCNATWETTEIR
jgi:ribosomal protein L44E